VLVPNAKGLEMALAAGVREIIWVISVSESHNRANVNRSVDESFGAFEAAWAGLGRDKPKLRLALSTCFDCPWEGPRPRGERHPPGRAHHRRGARGGDRHLRHHRPRLP
jgi:hydroxymethylglutaryl-CoA lyase